MKKNYIAPSITSVARANGIIPFAAVGAAVGAAAQAATVGSALLAGYAAGRAVTSSMKASPMRKLVTFEVGGAE